MGVAPAAPSAPGDDKILPGGHIYDDLVGFGIPHHRAPGDINHKVFTPLARHFPAHAVDARTGLILALIAKIQQCGQIVVDMENHAAAVTAVAAVGTAGGHIFFPVEGHRAVTAPSADDGDAYFIYKHKKPPFGS